MYPSQPKEAHVHVIDLDDYDPVPVEIMLSMLE